MTLEQISALGRKLTLFLALFADCFGRREARELLRGLCQRSVVQSAPQDGRGDRPAIRHRAADACNAFSNRSSGMKRNCEIAASRSWPRITLIPKRSAAWTSRARPRAARHTVGVGRQ